METKRKALIESLGVYLPPKSVSTDEVLEACKNPIRFPLEKISGIKNRRMAGQEEFSIDLAKKAISRCFENSKYNPEDIDLLVCCNISKVDGLDLFSFEPSASIKLKAHFGFTNAIAFDITNACAGMFTGVYIVNALLKTGAIRQGMVVSGEYITHLTKTAQKEMVNFMDPRLACLTLGDAGAAIILEQGEDTKVGFQQIDFQTFGSYSPFCVAKVSDQGGWIMHTDSVNLTDVGIKSGAEYALDIIQKAGWAPDNFQHVILHQTSRMTLKGARTEINNLLNQPILHDGNTIDNLEDRGNTASTSHFVALDDQIRNNRIQTGDRVVFGISASGLTSGTALYVFDDLPDRIRKKELSSETSIAKAQKSPKQIRETEPSFIGIRIESVGTIPEMTDKTTNSMDLLVLASMNCLEKSSYQSRDIGLLIHSGVYRSEFVLEPAYAALLAGKLNMNDAFSDPENKKTFAFDIFNGSMGFLNSCFIAQQMISAGPFETAMIVTTEIENNAELFPDKLLGIKETASAIILDTHPVKGKGFSTFQFNYYTEAINMYTVNCSTKEIDPILQIEKDPDLENKYLDSIFQLVNEFLPKEGLTSKQINMIFPPQISSEFITRLSRRLGISREKFIDVVGEGKDLFSSSIPFAVGYAQDNAFVKSGDIGLFIAVGSGIQAGCGLYYF